MNKARGLILNRFNNLRVAMTRRADGNASVAIQKDVAVNVCDPDALAPLCNELERWARVRRVHPLRVLFYNLPPYGAGQLCFNLRLSGRCNCGHDTFSF